MKRLSPFGGLKLLVVVLWLAALYTFLVRVFLPAAHTLTYGFMGYYTASWLLARGEWTPEVYDDARFNARVEFLSGGKIGDIISYNPPAVALILLPVAGLPPPAARLIWILANGLLLLFAGWLMFMTLGRKWPVNGWLWLGLSTLALVYTPLAENFRFGQVYVLLLCLYALALWGLMEGRAAPAGFGLGLAGVLKVSGLPLWFLLLTRRWPRFPWRLYAVACGLGVVSLLWFPRLYVAFLSRVPRELSDTPWLTLTEYQTTNSFLDHYLRFDARFNPAPLADSPRLADGLALLIAGLSLGLTLWRARSADLLIAFATATVLSVVLFPVAEQHHYVLLLLPLAALAADLVFHDARWPWLISWALAAALLALPFADWLPREWLNSVWGSLAAYPRLYGGWLLWGLLIARLKPSPPT